LEIVDFRGHTALSRRPSALLFDESLESFRGSLSGYRHLEADHNGEEEEEVVAHTARRAHERDESISGPETPKQRPATLPPSKAPAQRSNVSLKSKPPSVNHRDGLALSTDTSLQSGVSIPQSKFGTPGSSRDHGFRYSHIDDVSTFSEADSFVDPDNESHNGRRSINTASYNLLSMLTVWALD